MSRSDSFSILEVPLLDHVAILAQISSVVERFVLEYPESTETFQSLVSLYREVIKLEKTGLVPDLGHRLFALHQVVDGSVNCSALLVQKWLCIHNDQRTKDFLKAMTYLKLSACCGYMKAIYVWADLVKNHERLLYKAIDDYDLISLHNKAYDVEYILAYHEFVVHDMRLICEAYSEHPQYKLYMALKEAVVPWGKTCGSGGDGNVDTDEMVAFILEQLEGTN